MTTRPGLLARGPWRPDQVSAVWREDAYEASPEEERLADGAVEGLRDRGSPAHDGLVSDAPPSTNFNLRSLAMLPTPAVSL